MPVWLRKLTINHIESFYTNQAPPENDESWTSEESKKIAKSSSPKVKVPNYVVKASKK